MDNLGIGEWIVIGLSVLIGLGFIAGNWYNNQRVMATLAWLRRGLAGYGEVKSARVNAPTPQGFPLRIDPPEGSPFQKIIGILALERRENLPLWLFQTLRGKRDRLQLETDLRRGPWGEVYVFHKSNLSQIEAAKRGEKASLTFLKQAGDFHFYTRGEAPAELVACAEVLVNQLPSLILAFSLQRKSPNLNLSLRLTPLLRIDPQSFYSSIQKTIGA
jgi:hypothetical protein